ncbi:MAG: HesB/IscA family protein [Candidatus Dormibacteria bacterium]
MITVSDSARTQLTSLIDQQSQESPTATKVALRVFIEPGGCSGFSYGMGFDDQQPSAEDQVIELDGITVYVDSYSAQYLEGAEIDYVGQMIGGGFTIHNPNAVRSCSCGHSFQTADGAGEARACSH